MVFLVFTYRCESWTINKLSTEELMLLNMCWIRLLRFRWAARRSNKSILKEISPEYPLEGLMLKLKLQYFGHQLQRNDLPEKILMLLAPSSCAFHLSQNQVFSNELALRIRWPNFWSLDFSISPFNEYLALTSFRMD